MGRIARSVRRIARRHLGARRWMAVCARPGLLGQRRVARLVIRVIISLLRVRRHVLSVTRLCMSRRVRCMVLRRARVRRGTSGTPTICVKRACPTNTKTTWAMMIVRNALTTHRQPTRARLRRINVSAVPAMRTQRRTRRACRRVTRVTWESIRNRQATFWPAWTAPQIL